MGETILSVRDLHTQFHTDEGTVKAVDGISFDVERGETVCIVGESGSGKTVASESITKLIRMPPGDIPEGEVIFDGQDLVEYSDEELNEIRGGRIAHVFQNPQGALNPVYTVGWQIVEAIQLHRDLSRRAAREEAIELLDRVGIPEATARFSDYPHEFSGGMKQRVVIAMALASNPDLLIADEPTTALDVTIQAQILKLLQDLQAEFDMAILLITHDLGVVAEVADRVLVMYAGKVMERGPVHAVFENTAHPYTRALLDCLPGRGGELVSIGGSLPDPKDPPDGCRFADRCPYAVDECHLGDQPELYDAGAPDHVVSCLFYGPDYDTNVVREDIHEVVAESEATGRADGGRPVDDDGGGGGSRAPDEGTGSQAGDGGDRR